MAYISGFTLVNGDTYIIISQGTIDFTLYGSADNNQGTTFTSTGTPTLGSGDEVQGVYAQTDITTPEAIMTQPAVQVIPSLRPVYSLGIPTTVVEITNAVIGSSYAVVNRDTGDVLSSGTVDSELFTTAPVEFFSNINAVVYLRKAGYTPYALDVLINAGKESFIASQVVDSFYNAGYPVGIASDWTVDFTAKTITHTSGTTVYTVNELYSWLIDLLITNISKPVPMSAVTTTIYSILNGYSIPDASVAFLKGGGLKNGLEQWVNYYTIGAFNSATTLYWQQAGVVTTSPTTGHIDILVKSYDAAGAEVGDLEIFARTYGDTYDIQVKGATDAGRIAVAMSTLNDGNNNTAEATIAALYGATLFSGIYYDDTGVNIDITQVQIDGDDTPADYSHALDLNGVTLAEFFEYTKWLTMQGATTVDLLGQDGQVWRYVYSDDETKAAPLGVYAGGQFFGSQGLWIQNVASSDAYNYTLTDNAGVEHEATFSSNLTVEPFVDGSTIYVYDVTNDAVIANEVITGATSVTYSYLAGAGNTILTRVRKAGYEPFEISGITTTAGLVVTVSQAFDPVYETSPALIGNDWEVDTVAKEVCQKVGSAETIWTVREFHSWLQEQSALTTLMTEYPIMNAFTNYEFEFLTSDGSTGYWGFCTATDHEFLKTGSIVTELGNGLYANVYTIGTVTANEQIYIYQNGTRQTEHWGLGNLDVLIEVKTGGALIDSGDLHFYVRTFGYNYDHSMVTLTEGGKNAVALVGGADANNPTAEGTVAGYSDIVIDTTGTLVDITQVAIDATDTPSDYTIGIDANGRTVEELYEYLKYVTRDGETTFTLLGATGETYLKANAGYDEKNPPLGSFAGGVFTGARGVWVTNLDTADANNYVLYSNDNAVHSASPLINVSGIVAGSRIQVYDLTNSTELANEIVAGTTFTLPKVYVSDLSLRLRLTNVNGLVAYEWYEVNGNFTTTGASFLANQQIDTVYGTNGVDGSTVSECSISGTIVRVYVDDPDNTTTAQRIYNWYQYMLFSEAGIRDQSGDYINATDSTHYVFDDSMKIINQDLVNPLNITGANIIPESGAATNVFDLTNGASIALNFNRVEGFAYSSGSGLSPEEKAKLESIPSWTVGVDSVLTTEQNDAVLASVPLVVDGWQAVIPRTYTGG